LRSPHRSAQSSVGGSSNLRWPLRSASGPIDAKLAGRPQFTDDERATIANVITTRVRLRLITGNAS